MEQIVMWDFQTNTVKYLNGSTDYFLQTKSIHSQTSFIVDQKLLNIVFSLSAYKTTYQQYTEYQPVLSRRDLDQVNTTTSTTDAISKKETKEERNSDTVFMAFFIMAQIGGLYSFLRLVVGGLVSLFSDNLLVMEVINKLKDIKIRVDDRRASLYKSNSLQRAKIKPMNLEEAKDEEQVQFCDPAPNAAASIPEPRGLKYGLKDLIYNAICCFKRRTKKENSAASLGERNAHFVDDKQKLLKAVDITVILSSLRELKAIVNDLAQKDLNMASEMPFVAQSFYPKSGGPPENVYGSAANPLNPVYSEKYEKVIEKKETQYAIPHQPQNLVSKQAVTGTTRKTNFKEEAKSINNIVSREVSQILDEVSSSVNGQQ